MPQGGKIGGKDTRPMANEIRVLRQAAVSARLMAAGTVETGDRQWDSGTQGQWDKPGICFTQNCQQLSKEVKRKPTKQNKKQKEKQKQRNNKENETKRE